MSATGGSGQGAVKLDPIDQPSPDAPPAAGGTAATGGAATSHTGGKPASTSTPSKGTGRQHQRAPAG
ncbi:MAG TPA: hypothetical protein VJN18_19725 [Polyangiaceae bacterium]|nr:hypothetical protein [Polyangiaceae bacterium]